MNQNPNTPNILPKYNRPVDRLLRPIRRFFAIEASSSVLLLLMAILGVFLANFAQTQESFTHFWHLPAALKIGDWQFELSLMHVLNEGLMCLFFFVVGLEVKREMVEGELREWRKALLPIIGALGGMLVPAMVYLVFQYDTPARSGWGIPMATDIAFVVGCLLVLGDKVPHGLKILLLTLAIIDDIGAIMVIVLGYAGHINGVALLYAAVILGMILLLKILGVRNLLAYIMLGIALWASFLASGVHPTLAGVILGLLTPMDIDEDAGETQAPLPRLIHGLHPWVAFLVMPLFALANSGIILDVNDFSGQVTWSIAIALLLGKTLGVFGAAWFSTKLKITLLPNGVTYLMLFGGAILCGIGFTMALFIANLALPSAFLNQAKLGIFVGSILSAMVGLLVVSWAIRIKNRVA